MMRRLITAVVAVGAAVGTLFAASVVPGETVPPGHVSEVSVTPVDYPAACPGELEVPVGDIDAGDDDLAAGSDDRQRQVWADAEVTEIEEGDASIVTARVAATMERVGTGDIAGLAGLTCTPPEADQWLVGGSTEVGSSARLVAINPSGSTVEATVTLYGPSGQLDEGRTFSVGAGAQRELLLESVVADVPSLVVRVESTGAGVVTALQDSRLDGFQPAGTDWVGGVSTPSDEVVVVGVGDPEAAADRQESFVRLMSPDGATVDLTLVTPTGIVAWGGTSDLELEPSVVVDVPVPDGVFGAAEVAASEGTVLAGGMTRLSRAADEGLEGDLAADLGWSSGLDHRDADSRSAVVTSDTTHVVAYAPESAEFVLSDARGAVVAREQIGGRTVAHIPLNVAPGTVVSAEGEVVWQLRVTSQPGFLSTIAPVPTALMPQEWEIRVGPYVPTP